jgi:hypothetical protein
VKSKKCDTKKPKGAIKPEYAGHIIRANIWFKLGLSKTEASMLKTIAGTLFTKKVRSVVAARTLLQAALTHYDVLEPLIFQDARYRDDEGFTMLDCYLDGLITRQHAKLSDRKAAS